MTAFHRLSHILAVAASLVLTLASAHAGNDLSQAWEALQRGDAEESVRASTAAIAAGKLATEDVSAAYNLRGMAYMRMQDFADAEADFDVAVLLAPNFASALTNRGLARAKLEHFDDAIADFSRALTIVPGEPEVLFMRGNARFDSRDFAGAVEDYSGTLKAAPKHWMALMNRCDALGKLGRLDEAKADCEKAKPLAPDAEVVEKVEQALGPCDCKAESK